MKRLSELHLLQPGDVAELHPYVGTAEATTFWRGQGTTIDVHDLWWFLTSGVASSLVVRSATGRAIGLVELIGLDRRVGRGNLSVISWGPPLIRAKAVASIPAALNYWFSHLPLSTVAVLAAKRPDQRFVRTLDRYFVREGELRSAVFLDGETHDVLSYSITSDEFQEARTVSRRLESLIASVDIVQ